MTNWDIWAQGGITELQPNEYRLRELGNRLFLKKFWSRFLPGIENCVDFQITLLLNAVFAFVVSMKETSRMEETFVHLVAKHQLELRAFVVSMMPGSADVDDVIQEANISIWQKRGEFEIGSSFKAWMFSVAKFKVMAAWRDQKRRREWWVPEDVLTKLIEESMDDAIRTSVPRHEILKECLNQLRPEDRGLILRRYFDGSRVKALALEVGRSADSVKVSLRRIRLVLGMCIRRRQHQQEGTS
ncbi:MAG: sigma-70 family RNA polymerase sigma factor [Haloferula sp.]